MLILHAASSKEFDGVAFVWAEVEGKDRPQRKGKSRWAWLAGAREHPYQGDRDLLRAVLPGEVLRLGKWQWMTAWLPSDAAGPIPSEERIAPLSERHAERLAPWGVRVLMASAVCLHELFLACRGQVITEWQFGADGWFWQRTHELAGVLVARQQFLPGVIEESGHWFADWHPIYEADDLKRLDQLAEAMPLAVRALNWHPRRPPADTPHWIVHSLVKRFVGSIVKKAEVQHEVWETLSPVVGRRGTTSLHERWADALLLPGTEIRGSGQELVEFAVELARWREPLFRLPKLELGEGAPAISLPPESEDFWEGPELPADFLGPVEAPLNPALILRRVGELPGWRGERMLRDSLEPVYEAASRYALEYVFGRKPEPRPRDSH